MATSTSSRPSAAALRGRLPVPVRDRRPALAALALLLVVGGALGSALVAYRSGNRVDVLVASHDISVGEVVDASDFRTARVASEGAAVVPVANRDGFVGTRATGAIPAGTLINGSMFIRGEVVPSNAALVGVVLTPAQRPAAGLRAGDVVQVYAVSKGAGSVGTPTLLFSAVRVTDVGRADNGGNQSLSLLVPREAADTVVGAATSNGVTVVKLAAATKPVVDFDRG